ncbi:MAG: DUF2764 family protein [Lentisphaerae bacterium]|nr:DUF2764 family protein [Lentisphaerota bacterium]
MNTPPVISVNRFLGECRDHLSNTDMAALQTLDGDLPYRSNNSFVCQWSNAETQLRNALVRIRAEQKGSDPSVHIREQRSFHTAVEKAALDAIAKENPIDREIALDRHRWNLLDELAGSNPFATRALLAYSLKLKIAERWAAMEEKKGAEAADAIVNQKPHDAKAEETK